MTRTRLALTIAALIALFGGGVGHAARNVRTPEEEIRDLEARLTAATRTGDVAALADLCSPGFVAIPSDTLERYGKDDLLRSIGDERLKFSSYSSKILWVAVSGHMATVGAQDSLALLPEHAPFPYRSLRVYLRDGLSWRLSMAHSDSCDTCASE